MEGRGDADLSYATICHGCRSMQGAGLQQFEMCSVINLLPSSCNEVKALIPSIQVRPALQVSDFWPQEDGKSRRTESLCFALLHRWIMLTGGWEHLYSHSTRDSRNRRSVVRGSFNTDSMPMPPCRVNEEGNLKNNSRVHSKCFVCSSLNPFGKDICMCRQCWSALRRRRSWRLC